MRNLIILLLLILCQYNSLFSQNHRFFYEFQYKTEPEGREISKDILLLTIKGSDITFLSNKFVEIDSINANSKYQKQYINPQYNSILQYSNINKIFTSYKKLDIDYYNYDFSVDLKWKIHNEKKTILGFSVQKATTKYSGRNWIVWFSNEIQLPYGPHVFYGLPGLVLEAYDDKKNFHYQMIKSSNSLSHNFNLSNIFEEPPSKIQAKDWKKVQINYYNNPLYNYKTIGWIMYNKDGSQFTSKDYKELELQIKDGMRKYNNPIELDEKIDFAILK
ncbi:GLPGLI family protein [Chryseobacterium taihuense]|uniref:GLPGLI family protein n=1 Tax=Chryseobacterium taihuense TaxID=1141221 RepID=A0ABY0QW63_9FLAO|nr:GLPGLI family protein [Chryseobacterium taihuense]SDM00297.1 GLPGLI family protein [Chryseobacterium taihuense]